MVREQPAGDQNNNDDQQNQIVERPVQNMQAVR